MNDMSFTPDQRRIGEAAMAALLARGPATMSGLASEAATAIGGLGRVRWACHRMADRWLQKRRKAGEVVFERGGGRVLWREVGA